MGQNSSTLHTSSTLPRTKPRAIPEAAIQTSPVAIPASLPDSPSKSSYLVPENKVLPSDTGDVGYARKHLRPVSQDLAKFHPDYADIFPSGGPEAEDKGGSMRRSASMPGLDKENSGLDVPGVPGGGQRANGHVRAMSNVTNGYHLMTRSGSDLGSSSVDPEQWNDLRRAQSVDRGISAQGKPYRHSRQTSLASRNSLQDTVILEDPREHLYNIARKEPFSDLVPTTTSLPVKSSFEMDYSFNLTYAQLTEHRRQKRTKELEERTGKKLEDLSAEISAASTLPKSPFDHRNLGGKPSTHSVSTGSSDTGVSKSKKKKAPAPPPPPIPPFRYTLTNEPPVDYEMQNSASQPRTKRSNSSVSAKTKPPAPQPLPKRHSMTTLQAGPSSSASSTNQIPLPPSLSTLFSKSSSSIRNDKIQPPGFDLLQKSKAETQRQIEALKKLEETLKRVESGDSTIQKEKVDSDKKITGGLMNSSNLNQKAKSETILDAGTNSKTQRSSDIPPPPPVPSWDSNSKPASTQNSPVKVMNSLLQHDIVLAAQARGAKILKPKTPAVSEKPKDPAEIFQEELAKAALAREERRKSATSNNAAEPASDSSLSKNGGEDRVLLFESSILKVTKSSSIKVNEELQETHADKNANILHKNDNDNNVMDIGKNSEENIDENELDEMKIAESVDMSKRPSIQSEAMSISSSNTSQRMFASDWIPEVDLDFDDDIMDEKISMSHKRVSLEGFKSSIIPSKLNELQNAKEKKKKKGQAINSSSSLGDITSSYPPVEDKAKFGSVRKFKQGVRNAFGSISKASGKLFKKPKSKDKYLAESVDDVFRRTEDERLGEFLRDQNWVLSDSRGNSLQRYNPSMVGSESEESSYSDNDDVGDIDFAGGIDQLPSPRLSEAADDDRDKGLKRAGVAYVSKKGQIIVLPEYKYGAAEEARGDRKEDEGRAPKIVRKKNKKYAYESTVRVQQKSRLELEVAKEILEKEKQIEFERQRQLNMEKDFQRLRDLETQERLHRLQSATIKDQIDLLQQQRAQYEINNNVGGVSSQAYPQYFPNGGVGMGNPAYLNSYVPIVGGNVLSNNAMPAGYSSGHGTTLAGNGMMAGGPSVSQLTPQELNRISEYMRRMGVAPPANQQQWAVLLSTVSFSSQGIPGYDQKAALYSMGSGPNLSHIFTSGKSMDSAAPDNGRQIVSYVPSQQAFMNTDSATTGRANHTVGSINPHLQSPTSSGVQQELHRSSVSVGSSPVRKDGSIDHIPGGPLKSPTLSSKVYSPLGYRPVAFQNHIT